MQQALAAFDQALNRLSRRCDQASAAMQELCVTPNRWSRKFSTYEQVQQYMAGYDGYPHIPEVGIDSPEMQGYFDAEKDATWREEAQQEAREEAREREEW